MQDCLQDGAGTPRLAFIVAALASSLLIGIPAEATTTFNDGLTHAINDNTYSAESIIVENSALEDPTTVEILPGADIGRDGPELSVSVFDASIVNMSGGSTKGDVEVNDMALIAVSGGIIGEDLHARGQSTVILSGGSVASDLRAFDNATINISGGLTTAVGGVDGLKALDDSNINIFSIYTPPGGPQAAPGGP